MNLTYEDLKRIRSNKTAEQIYNAEREYRVEIARMIDEAIEKRIPKKMVRFKDKCECGHECFPHMQFCDVCGKKLEWVNQDEKGN